MQDRCARHARLARKARHLESGWRVALVALGVPVAHLRGWRTFSASCQRDTMSIWIEKAH